MMCHKQFIALLIGSLLCAPLYATLQPSVLNNAQGVRNNTKLVVEFSGLIGGYASVNPLIKPGQQAKLLPDPGSQLLRGHMMIYAANQPGHYLDNIVFVYQKIGKQWRLSAYDLYKQVSIKTAKKYLTIN